MASLPRCLAGVPDQRSSPTLAVLDNGGSVQGHPRFAGAIARMAALKTHNQVKRATKAGFLEPGFAAVKAAVTFDPVGPLMRKLCASFRSMPDPLLLGARNIKGGEYGEGTKGEAGGVDVGLSVARFGPCVFKGGAEVAGAYAKGVRVAPTALDLGASGAAVTPKLVDVSPTLVDVHPKGVDVSPAEINISPTLIQVAPGFTASRPGTVQAALISAMDGLAGVLGGGPGGGG